MLELGYVLGVGVGLICVSVSMHVRMGSTFVSYVHFPFHVRSCLTNECQAHYTTFRIHAR